MKARISFYIGLWVLLVSMAATIGCNKMPNDAQIAADVQTKMSTDSGLAGKQLAVQAASGAVTLSGNVDNDAQRDAAARYAAAVPGVKQVINNLVVAPPASEPVAAQAQAPAPQESKPSPAPKRHRSKKSDDDSNSAPPQVAQNPTPAPEPVPAVVPVAPAPPPPPPPPQKVTIAQGTTLAIRLVDALDSETATQGQTFRATLNSPLAVDGDVAIPAGYDVEGHVVQVQSAGKFAGQSVLVLQLDRIKAGDKFYNIQTDQYKKQ
jgi:BON domain